MILRSKYYRTPFLLVFGIAIAAAVLTSCNSNPGPDSISSRQVQSAGVLPDCVICHTVAFGSRRAIMGVNGDFAQNPAAASHHISGVADPTAAQCLICHNIDEHGSGTVRLNHADTGAVIAATSNADVETFCLSCHDTLGANGNMNPFADGRTLNGIYPVVSPGSRFPNTNGVVITGWTNPNNAHTNDGIYATASPAQNSTIVSEWGSFGFDAVMPAKIERGRLNSVVILVEYHINTAPPNPANAFLSVQASVAGVDCPAAPRVDPFTGSPLLDTVAYFEVSDCRSWSSLDLSDGRFAVKLLANRGNDPTTYTFSVDYVAVQITYDGTSYLMSTRIKDSWDKLYGHRRRGLTCLGTGAVGTGCHLNGHGSSHVALLARKLELPYAGPDGYSVADEGRLELCFSCHESYATVSRSAVFGVRKPSNYEWDHWKLDFYSKPDWWNYSFMPPYSVPTITTKFRDRQSNMYGSFLNLHWFHVGLGAFSGGWMYRDIIGSGIHCLTCHNIHGSNTQWGSIHDEMLYGQYTDASGLHGRSLVINTNPSGLANFPISCAYNCHTFDWPTDSWIDPSGE